MFNLVSARVTSDAGNPVVDNRSSGGKLLDGILKVVQQRAEMAASGVFATITALINALSISLFLALYMFMGGATGTYTRLPLPDNIVFNRFAFFDPNFIYPATDSLTDGFQSVLGDLFASFQAIAIAVFVISAMVMGLKMALSTIAAKKAQYKELAMKWITGFCILLCLKWILAGIFYSNEIIVAKLYDLTKEDDLMIEVAVYEMIPIFGKLLGALFEFVGVDELFEVDIPGYAGIALSNLCKATGGDIIASIVAFVLMGQTLTIVGSYLKRLFMCLVLGIISPLIVAVDTITSATGKQSNIFSNWLKNFSTTVFMQTIHSAYMVVSLQILAEVYNGVEFNGMQNSIVTIVLTTGLVKLEKLIKALFGIGDSLAGDLKDGGKSMLKAMGAVKGLTAAASALKDNVPKMQEAAKKKQAYRKELNSLKSGKSDANNRYKDAMDAARDAKHRGDTAEYTKQMKLAMEARRESVYGAGNKQANSANEKGSGNKDYLQSVVDKHTNTKPDTVGDRIRQLEEGIAKETTNYKSAALATIMGPANLAAGIGFGIGMGDDISETLMKGGFITAALDKGTEMIGARAADKDRRTLYQAEKQDGEKYGYKPSEKIIREKTIVEKTVQNAIDQKLYIDPIAVGKEIGKQMKGVGDVFANSIKREMRQIDKHLDDSQ